MKTFERTEKSELTNQFNSNSCGGRDALVFPYGRFFGRLCPSQPKYNWRKAYEDIYRFPCKLDCSSFDFCVYALAKIFK
jgi:hypothetical protein